jgi:hypothetical protein
LSITIQRPKGWETDCCTEVISAVEYIEEFPELAALGEHSVRRKVLARFPYSILYIIQQGELIILAVAHQSRRPNYWIDRLPSE